MCVDICVCVYVFIQDPDPGSDPKLCEKSDPDPKKIIPDPQHCFTELLAEHIKGTVSQDGFGF
jgi:hypothetical protein